MVIMNEITIGILLGVLGAMLGSFAGAQVWRLRARQLVDDKKLGNKVDKAEYKRLLPLTKSSLLKDRSIDLDTGKVLPWYDLIPVVSWLLLRGKSRYSGKPIGYFEFVIEVGLAIFFVGSFIFWPQPLDSIISVAQFSIWLIAGLILAVQFALDFKWKFLWSSLSYAVIGLGLIYVVLAVVGSADRLTAAYSAVGSVLILGGLYYALYAISRERWVGLGDVFLGIGLGLLLADWRLALIALFMANLIGCIVVIPGMIMKKIGRHQQVPFGPFFILGAIVAQLWGVPILDFYFSLLLI